MSYKLFLDDFREVRQAAQYMFPRIGSNNNLYNEDGWIVAKNYDEFTDIILKNGIPDLISYDHDLADEHYIACDKGENRDDYKEKTGLDCAKWMLEFCKSLNKDHPPYFIHSMNPIGTENIRKLLKL